MKHLIIVVVVLALGWLAWTKLPGLRTKVSGAVDEYGGWTEEARADDPVGFLTYAEEKLTKDIAAFRASRSTLAEAKTNAEAEKKRNEGLLTAADELAGSFRAQYRTAETSGAWPVTVGGASYDQETLTAQVESILGERESYEKVVAIYADVIDAAETQRVELRSRIQSTEATLSQLKAQKELVRVDKLTAEADELLAQIDVLISGNQKTLTTIDEPVRSVEALIAASLEPDAAPDSATHALEFLNAE
jgi:phage shock protein A